jgi:nitric oxide reductase subunit B
MFGDGALRGPDFTAQALHIMSDEMQAFYQSRLPSTETTPRDILVAGIRDQVQREIKTNRYDAATNRTMLSAGQVAAAESLPDYYSKVFTNPAFPEAFHPTNYITDPKEIRQLAQFFFWGAWVCSTERPGTGYSYTHNWPYDPDAGNRPTPATMVWSIIGLLGLILGLGIVLHYYGQMDQLSDDYYAKGASEMVTERKLISYAPTPTQRASFKYFYVAAVLLLVQVLAGILTVHDFVGFTQFFGVDLREWLPVTIVRSWHLQIALYWISACWVGGSIFILPLLTKQEPKGQVGLVNLLFWVFFLLVVGSVVGIFMGPKGLLGEMSRWLGHQGWEFVELGRLYQYMLLGIFALWAWIVYRGVKPVLQRGKPWALPNWLAYAVIAILLLLLSGFVATPQTNFVIADFWRWCVIHMWVEAFFEVFTTIVVGYLMVLMGLVSREAVTKVVFLATLLFLGSGLLGISHNFYWNAKPVGTLAIGSVFSTLQVVPLILLTLEAWRFRSMPAKLQQQSNGDRSSLFAMQGVFLFLIGVNFWNFFGAGVFGLIINLPIVNYYEHGTYLTVNHGHAALMGVYGNLSIAAILFCYRYLIVPVRWNAKLVRTSFWSLNIGLFLMVALDLFPAGVHQLFATIDNGLWFSRSQTFIQGGAFQTMTWLRIIGGSIFFLGGVLPLVWFTLTRIRDLKSVPGPERRSMPVPDAIPAESI